MTKIKLCGLTRAEDIACANEIKPDYIGFVFWQKSSRCVDVQSAGKLKTTLDPAIKAVGVFVDGNVNVVADIANDGIIDVIQLHGSEDENYIAMLKSMTPAKIIKAFKIKTKEDIDAAIASTADLVLLDAGMGDGRTFDWDLIKGMTRPYILAGGLGCDNVKEAVIKLDPYGVDVSSGIETDGRKDPGKMRRFADIVRESRV